MDYFINVDYDAGYWFQAEQLRSIEKNYGAKYMGYWCVKTRYGWSDYPVEVFFQTNPDRSKGHTNYFGIFMRNNSVFITDAESAFSVPITGVVLGTGEVLVSKYRHDCVVKDGVMIDGGREYLRTSVPVKRVNVQVHDEHFFFSEIEEHEYLT